MKGKKILMAVVCLVLVIAIVLGVMWQQGMFEKPVQPDNRWTIRNLTLDLGEEEAVFDSEIRVSAVEEADKDGNPARKTLHFEIGRGEKALVPVTAELAGGTVSFRLGEGNVYSLNPEELVSDAVMQEVVGLDPALLNSLKDFVESCGEMMQLQYSTDYMQKNAELMDGVYGMMIGGDGEETEISVDGKNYKGRHYSGSYTIGNAMAGLDYMRENGDELMKKYLDSMLQVTAAAMQTEMNSFADYAALITGEAAEAELPLGNIELWIVNDKKLIYQKASMTQEDGVGGVIVTEAEQIYADGLVTMDMRMDLGEMGAMTMTMNYGGGVFGLGASYDLESNLEVMGINCSSITDMDLTAGGATVEGLTNFNMNMTLSNEQSYDFGDGPESETSLITLTGAYDEAPQADESITGVFDLNLDLGTADYGLGFELNRGKEAVLPALVAGDTAVQTLGADTESEAYSLLQADALALVGGAAELLSDPGVAKVMEFVSAMIPADEPVAEDKVPEEDAAYEDEFETVMSFAEAEAIYGGKMPVYTAPEGWELMGINVDDYSMYIGYSKGESVFQLSLIDVAMAEDTSAPAAIAPDAYEYYEESGLVYDAYTFTENAIIEFTFDGLERAEAEAIIAGLKL